MPDILQLVEVELHCVQCDDSYKMPAALIAQSQRMLEEGCPGTSEHECAPAFYASLIEPQALQSLVRAWEEVQRSASAHGERAMMRAKARVDLAVAITSKPEIDPLARWEDDGGAIPGS